MGLEIERKFLVDTTKWNNTPNRTKEFYAQGYIVSDPHKTVRIRTTETKGYITIKGKSIGATRSEFEYEIPIDEAKSLLENFCESKIEKTRTKIQVDQHVWEVDEFLGDNEGLIVAEIELTHESEHFSLPDWVLNEVTGEIKYYNSQLLNNPFKNW